jgi:hypothetical protein
MGWPSCTIKINTGTTGSLAVLVVVVIVVVAVSGFLLNNQCLARAEGAVQR